MKSTGVVRKLDRLGRIVLPMELRKNLEIDMCDALEIYVEGNSIVLKKHQPSCIFCGEDVNIANIEGKNICSKCLKQICNMSQENVY